MWVRHARGGVCRVRSFPRRFFQTAFLFPGQGSQYVGMSRVNENECSEVKSGVSQLYDRASSILGYDLYELCLSGIDEEINSTRVAQVAIFVNSMAVIEKLKRTNNDLVKQCSIAMGLSLGEYSALCFSGALSFEDGIRLTKVRGEAMQAASDVRKGGMVAIMGLDEHNITRLCRDAVEISLRKGEAALGTPTLTIGNYLGAKNFAVSGDILACQALQLAASNEPGVKVSRILPVAGAFHTHMMQSAFKPLEMELEKVKFSPEKMLCPVVSNVTGDTSYFRTSSAQDIREALLRQVISPVRWDKSMHMLLSNKEFRQACEIGPGTVCSGIVKSFNRRAKVTSHKLQ